jgi:hypothetical protein
MLTYADGCCRMLTYAQEYTYCIAIPLWNLSCFWYMEVMKRALGWPNWMTGLCGLKLLVYAA